MTELSITFDDLLSFGPCYSDEQLEAVRAAFGGRSVTALEIARDVWFPAADRLWLILREELIPASTLHLLACDFADRALFSERRNGREPDSRSWAAIEAKRRWVAGAIDATELAVARLAAHAAALAAGHAAAHAATMAATMAAAAAAATASESARRAAWWSEARCLEIPTCGAMLPMVIARLEAGCHS